MSTFLDGVVAWLLTFALHSTCALGGALLLTLLLRTRAVGAQEAALRWSLWAALLSATLQVAVLGSPWSVGDLGREAPAVVPASIPAPEPLQVMVAKAPPASAPIVAESVDEALDWRGLLGAFALLAAGGGLVWLWLVQSRLRTLLRTRRPETDPRVLTLAARAARGLGLQQSPHLSRCARIATPIAFGWLRPEICLPERVDDLDDASLRAMLAHELAHLRRADPAWMWGAAVLQALFPWQPLLLVVRRRWAQLVELQCDAVAAHHAGSTAVARCLLDVAEWLRPDTQQPLGALGMAARPSALRVRVETALRGDPCGEPDARRVHLVGGLAVGVLVFAAPGLATVPAGDGVLPFVDRVDAPATASAEDLFPSPSPAGDAADAVSPVVQLLAQLTAEQRELQQEAADLQASLALAPEPELRDLQTLLVERLRRLETQRQRLGALLAARANESRANETR